MKCPFRVVFVRRAAQTAFWSNYHSLSAKMIFHQPAAGRVLVPFFIYLFHHVILSKCTTSSPMINDGACGGRCCKIWAIKNKGILFYFQSIWETSNRRFWSKAFVKTVRQKNVPLVLIIGMTLGFLRALTVESAAFVCARRICFSYWSCHIYRSAESPCCWREK